MINYDNATKEIIKKKQSKLATNSQSSIENIDNSRLWIWKNKRITQSDKKTR